jgi:hypothetical protein
MTLLSDADGTATGTFDAGMPREDASFPVPFGVLTTEEWKERHFHEEVFDRNTRAFDEFGRSLDAFRRKRLYRETHATFDDYCLERLGITSRRAYQFIEAAEVVQDVKNFSQKLPVPLRLPRIESHAKALASLIPEQRGEAWQRVVETIPEGKLTAAHVESVAREYREPDPAPESEDWTLKDAIKHLKSTMYDISQEWPQQYLGAMVGQLRSLADELTKYGKLRP